MKDSKFIREIKLLINFVRSYGIQHLDYHVDINSLSSIEINERNEIIKKIHTGFFLAQNNVIRLLTKVLNEQKELKKQLKESRRNHDEQSSKEYEKKLNKAKYQECTLRKIMDSIAWQIFNYDLSSIRRLYTGNRCIDITDSNLMSEIDFIDSHKEHNPTDFVLINDLTSFLQIGDITIVNKDKKTQIVELKTGKVNNEILDIINDFSTNLCPQKLSYTLASKDEKFIKQLRRDIKQMQKAANVESILNTGEGFDNVLEQNIKIIQEEIELDTFSGQLSSLIKKCQKKNYAISIIENCLCIGVYNTNKFPSTAFDVWINPLKFKTPVFDLKQSLTIPLAYPLFLHPFSENILADIVSGDIVIKMAINIEALFKKFEEKGLKAKWLSQKETARINTRLKGANHLYMIDGCGISIEKDGKSYFLFDGLILRMFSNLNTPSAIVKYVLSTFDYTTDEK